MSYRDKHDSGQHNCTISSYYVQAIRTESRCNSALIRYYVLRVKRSSSTRDYEWTNRLVSYKANYNYIMKTSQYIVIIESLFRVCHLCNSYGPCNCIARANIPTLELHRRSEIIEEVFNIVNNVSQYFMRDFFEVKYLKYNMWNNRNACLNPYRTGS